MSAIMASPGTAARLNVAYHLVRQASEQPERPALYVPLRSVRPHRSTPHRLVSYAQLNALSDALAHGLEAAGIERGMRTALFIPPSVDLYAVVFALFKLAAVPVFIDPAMGLRGLRHCLQQAAPSAFIGVARAHLARWLLGWAKDTLRIRIQVGRPHWFGEYALDSLYQLGQSRGAYPIPDVAAHDTAAILFTSGSTGPAKGAVYTHGIFAAQIEMLRTAFAIRPGEIDYGTFPLFALFGPALGMSCVIPDMDTSRPARLKPEKVLAQMRQLAVTSMFGSPAVLRVLGEWYQQQHGYPRSAVASLRPSEVQTTSETAIPLLPTVRRVITAGAPASPLQLARFARLLSPQAEIFTPYGATEALPVANIGSGEILAETQHLTAQGRGVCIGRPLPGIRVHVIPITDEAIPYWRDDLELPVGTIGELVVRGPIVTPRYYNQPQATAAAKILDQHTGEVLHRMGDVGYWDEQGRLWYCGRKSQRVVTLQGTLFTEMVEPVFHGLAGVRRTALVGVKRGTVTYPVLCVEWDRREPWPAVLARLLSRNAALSPPGAIAAFLPYPKDFPVDRRHNAKIARELLACWAQRRLGAHWQPLQETSR
ncbi:MAG: fatty acid CoA ligase family protein [Thermogemmata sp.]|nr:fatty acid CoA ligase family protein [Thermogemmata sp.]